jgi:glycine/D-amino acid oxidase-like deaminating enzyme
MDLRSGLPYWRLINKSHILYPALNTDLTCEIAIVGGGITGALAAFHLAQDGLDVVLLDKRSIGSGSTAASSGLLSFEADVELNDLIDTIGQDQAVRRYRLGTEAIGTVRNMCSSLGDDFGFEEREGLYLASKKSHIRRLRREFEVRKHFGFDVEYFDETELRERYALNAPAAILSRPSAQVDPLRLTQQLIAAAAERGARVFEQTSVKSIEGASDGAVLVAQNGQRVRAKRVFVAAGCKTSDYLEESASRLHNSFALASTPVLDLNPRLHQCTLWETARPNFYLRNLADNCLIIGGMDSAFSSEHAQHSMIPKQGKKLAQRFGELFPGHVLNVCAAWAGVFGDAKHGLAYVGTSAKNPRAHFAVGYAGNGIVFGVIASRIIADLFLERDGAEANAFRLR